MTTTQYKSLIGKTAFITGGASGIGAAILTELAKQKTNIAFIDIDQEASLRLAAQLKQQYQANVWFDVIDATNSTLLQQAITRAGEHFGGIDILVNNVANDMRHSPEKISPEQWQSCMDINLSPTFYASQAAYPFLKKSSTGSIINFSSINALIGPAKMVGYNTAKAGIVGMTKSLATDFGRFNIRVNAVLPGWVATEKQLALWLTEEEEKKWTSSMAIKQRIEPEEVAKLVLFLSSDDSKMITGQSISIDGGRT